MADTLEGAIVMEELLTGKNILHFDTYLLCLLVKNMGMDLPPFCPIK